jgi:nucleoside-diphosphate-sugar epimerase
VRGFTGPAAVAGRSERIILTGASGWLGKATLAMLAEALGDDFKRRVHCFGSERREIDLGDGLMVMQSPLAALAELPSAPSWMLHLAFLTKDRVAGMKEADYIAACRHISESVEHALDRIGVTGLFVPSSGAAYRANDMGASPAMRLYGSMKLADEELFANWADRTGHTAVIARVFNVTGAYINKFDAYALASFIVDALYDRPIKIQATRPVLRSFVATRELMSLVFALLAADDGLITRFDTAGEEILEMGALARTVQAIIGSTGAVFRPPLGTEPADFYAGERAGYQALVEQFGIAPVPMAVQIGETAAYIAGVLGLPPRPYNLIGTGNAAC